jgi:hypothetical protein
MIRIFALPLAPDAPVTSTAYATITDTSLDSISEALAGIMYGLSPVSRTYGLPTPYALVAVHVETGEMVAHIMDAFDAASTDLFCLTVNEFDEELALGHWGSRLDALQEDEYVPMDAEPEVSPDDQAIIDHSRKHGLM